MASRSKVLAVDDNVTNIMLYEELLEENYELFTAVDGQEALEKVIELKPDAVLLDIMMPGLSGYEVCTAIRKLEDIGSTIKVILVSARNTTEDRIIGYEAGADDYLIKPFDEDELEAKLQVFLKLKSLEEVDQLKSSVMSMFSNETRTPLNGILGPLQLLMSNNDNNTAEERMNWLNMIAKSAEDLQSLVDKVLLLSNLRSGQRKLDLHSINSLELLEHLVYQVKPVTTARGVEICLTDVRATELSVDRDLIFSCLTTIVDNALNFSKSGDVVEVSAAVNDEQFEVKVSDASHRVDSSVLSALLGDSEVSQHDVKLEGRSLSLSIAREIAELHSGRIDAASNDAEGTVFRLTLPMSAAQ